MYKKVFLPIAGIIAGIFCTITAAKSFISGTQAVINGHGDENTTLGIFIFSVACVVAAAINFMSSIRLIVSATDKKEEEGS